LSNDLISRQKGYIDAPAGVFPARVARRALGHQYGVYRLAESVAQQRAVAQHLAKSES
jgi:hypothetical protein